MFTMKSSIYLSFKKVALFYFNLDPLINAIKYYCVHLTITFKCKYRCKWMMIAIDKKEL